MCTALPVYVSVYCVHTWYTQKSEESIGSPGTGVKDGCVSPCGTLETEPGFARAAVLLTTEPLSSTYGATLSKMDKSFPTWLCESIPRVVLLFSFLTRTFWPGQKYKLGREG